MNFIFTPMKFLLLLILPVSLFAQQSSSGVFAAPLNFHTDPESASSSELLADRENWQEIPAERTLTTSTYHTADGRVIVRTSSRPLNYNNASNELVPIDAKLKPLEKGKGWAALDQPHPVYLFDDGSEAVSLENDELFAFGRNCKINGQWNYNSLSLLVNDNKVMLENVVPGVNKEIVIRENGVKYNYIITHALNNTGDYFTITEELVIPQGYTLREDHSEGRAEHGGWTGDLELVDGNGMVNSKIFAPIIFDANNQWTLGTYKVETVNGKTVLQTLLPNAWLNAPSRTYPVTIDPLITGPTSLWTGGAMPSCIAPAYNTDSILVTIPGQISVTGLVVTASFYADPFTTAIMSDGAMWFSTNCAQTQQFVIGGSAGSLPGTAYLDTFNMRSPLLCCYPQSCNQQQFYLRMHLNRTQPGTGCNTTYIRYDPTTTLWPFEAFVVGHTVESFGNAFSVQTAAICSRQCTFNATVYIRYGVPPFTITHPWLATAVTVGNPLGCSFATTIQPITLTRPNCPTFCDTSTVQFVPAPTVTDACGNVATGYLPRNLNLKPTPVLTATPDPEGVCSGSPYQITLQSCIAGATATWTDGTSLGTGNISGVGINNGTTDSVVNYIAFSTLNGCNSDTIYPTLVIVPDPVASFIAVPDPFIAGIGGTLSDNSSTFTGTANAWQWTFGDSTSSTSQNPVHTYTNPGFYTVCMQVTTDDGCTDTICQTIEVIPAEVVAPNVVTPNGDNLNDKLIFQFLEYYPNNHLDIIDRWGVILLSKDSYVNDWDGSKYTDGTYYYVLTIAETGKTYKGFFTLIK